MADESQIFLAATVLLVRDGSQGLEVLYVQRNAKLAFHGGAWVYPGGRIDPADFSSEPDDLEAAARRAAAREAHEEAGVATAPETMLEIAEWTTPPVRPKRFRTWFFLAPAGSGEVTIDGGEIHDHRWLRPADALTAQAKGEMELPAPTYVTSHWLAEFAGVDETFAAFRQREVPRHLPRTAKVPGGVVSILSEDAAFAGGDLDQPGPRHRVWMLEGGWRYERSSDLVPRGAS